MKKNIIIAIISVVIIIILGFILLGGKVKADIVANNLELGNKYLNEGNYKEAIISFNKVIKIESKNIEARLGLSDTYIATDNFNEAINVLNEAIEIDITKPDGYLKLIEAYEIADKDLNEIIDLIKKAYEVNEDSIFKELLEKLNYLVSKPDNTLSNLRNYGFVTEQGDWLFIGSDAQLYKIRKDGSDKTVLIDNVIASRIQVKGNWVYYNSLKNGSSELYKVRTDGTKNAKISEGTDFWDIIVIGDWIYYDTNEVGGSSIHKMNTDGTNNTRITKIGNSSFDASNVTRDWIYYKKSSSEIYKVKPDGSQDTKVNDANARTIYVEGNWIYYPKYEMNGWSTLYKMKKDGTMKSQASYLTFDLYLANIYGEWAYCTNDRDSNRYENKDNPQLSLYKFKTDGSEYLEVSDEVGYYINIVDNWIYYTNPSDNHCLYKMKTDGTEVTKISNDTHDIYKLFKGSLPYYKNRKL